MEGIVQFDSKLDRHPGKGGLYYMVVPDEIAAQFVSGRKPERVRCTLNEVVKFQCAVRPMGGGGFYINVGTPIRQEGHFVLGQKLSASLQKDDSKYGRDMPEELAELLAIDEDGNKLFHQLLPSHQRAIIYYVDGAKAVQVRIDRAIMMIDRLKKQGSLHSED